jgi:hypothetical protein
MTNARYDTINNDNDGDGDDDDDDDDNNNNLKEHMVTLTDYYFPEPGDIAFTH